MVEHYNLRLLHPFPPMSGTESDSAEPPSGMIAAASLVIHAESLPQTVVETLQRCVRTVPGDGRLEISTPADDGPLHSATLVASRERFQELARQLDTAPTQAEHVFATELTTLLERTASSPAPTMIRQTSFDWRRRTYIMGIINVTPDSFSGDGLLTDRAADAEIDPAALARAVEQARDFVAAGADLLDVGGESSRPGATAVAADDEMRRVAPLIKTLRAELETPISIDSWKAQVVAPALDAGADLVNDIWGLRLPGGGWNEALAHLVASWEVPIVLMHNRRATPARDHIGGHYAAVAYRDLLGEVIRDLRESIAYAESKGIRRERIIVDPGIGFGKTPAQNMVLLRHLNQLCSLGLPILLGTSRKSFIGRVLDLPPDQRVEGTGVTLVLGIERGANLLRVHDVAPLARVVRMADAMIRSEQVLRVGS